MTHILLVEDEQRVRLLVATILISQGHTVLEAEDGQQALDMLELNPTLEIVITDLVMPYVDGLKLIKIIGNDYPKLHIIAMSAYHEQLDEAQASGADHTLKKPFSHQQLTEVVNVAVHHLSH